jgi:large subunit ribosomal protein L21
MMMFAVIKTGGKQYKVFPGTVLKIEQLAVDEGSTIEFNDVLMAADSEQTEIGTPLLTNSTVTAIVQKHGRHDKVRTFKLKRRKNHRKRMGHRQHYTEIKVTSIKTPTMEAVLLAKDNAKSNDENTSPANVETAP